MKVGVVRVVIWLLLMWALLPHQLQPLTPGVDGSWIWGINHVGETGARPGADYVYTYGPLGWVVQCVEGSPHLRQAAVMRLALHALFGLVLAFALRRRPLPQVCGFAVATLLAAGVGVYYEVQLIFWCALTLAVAVDSRRTALGGMDTGPLEAVAVATAETAAGSAGAATVTNLTSPRSQTWPLGLARAVGTLGGALGAACAIFLLLTKISVGASAAVMSAGFGLWLAWQRAWRSLATVVGAAVVSAVIAVWCGFGSWSAVAGWLAGERELLAGFGAAMGIAGPLPELVAALVCLAIWASLAAWAGIVAIAGYGNRPPSRLAPFAVICLPVVWLAFRHGFARQDVHVVIFFGVAIGLSGIAVLLARTRREFVATVAAGGVIALAGCGDVVWFARGGAAPMAAAWETIAEPRATWRTLAVMLAPEILPPARIAAPRAARATFDAVPQELDLLAANHLRWVPGPTLQFYLAYTAYLDNLGAAHFAGVRAPDFLLARYESVDGRNPLWDPPATWVTILQHYVPWHAPLPASPATAPAGDPHPADSQESGSVAAGAVQPAATAPERFAPATLRGGLVLLRRRPWPDRWISRDGGRQRFATGDALDVPPAADVLIGALDLQPTLAGRLLLALLRLPPVTATVYFDDGAHKTWRLVPATARDGLLLAPLPRNAAGFPLVFAPAAAALPRAVAIRLGGPGLRYYESEAAMTWRYAVRQGSPGMR